MPGPAVLSRRQLNRALLARQMLLKREKLPVIAAIERLVAMQAQVPRPPFMGLWTRLEKFRREQLLTALRDRSAVRATAMRGTIHLMSMRDFVAFRPVLSGMLVKGAQSISGKRMAGVELEPIYETGRRFFGGTPAPFEALRSHLEKHHPGIDVRAMAYSVRMGVPLVIVPGDAEWGFAANAGFTLAEKWLGRTIPETSTGFDGLVLRYLAAFGPATPGDFQAWSGLRAARETFERLRGQLVTFRDERKRELFDLPKAPRPEEDVAAPPRFLPEFDNILLGHDDRTRIISDAHRSRVFLKNLQVLGTVLIDGFVAATWRLERGKKTAHLAVQPFGPLARRVATDIQAEGTALLEFLEPEADDRSVSLANHRRAIDAAD